MAVYKDTTSIIVNELYNFVAPKIEKNVNRFKSMMANFINRNHKAIYDVAPYEIIYFTSKDIDDFFKSLDISPTDVISIMKDCFFWNIPIKPQVIKEPYILVSLCIIRYFLKTKKRKEAELTGIYLAFSGKIYASLYSGVAFPTVAPSKYRAVMDFVVNNMMSNKFDIKSQGNIFGAMQQLVITWLNKYGDELCEKDIDDDRIKVIFAQLRDRVKSFLMNIAKMYYEAYKNKNYLNFESDNLTDGSEFRITDNDAAKATRLTEISVAFMTNNSVSLAICNKCKDANIKPTEIKDILDAVLFDKMNLNSIYRVTNILICDFIKNYPGVKVGGIDFIAHSIKAKPNNKDEYINEMRSIILSWLDEKSENYRRRKSRIATAISYYKAILMYFTLAISKACEKHN